MRFVGRTTAAVVEFPDRRILLVKRLTIPFRGYWALPGGRVEAGETVEQTVVREVGRKRGLTLRSSGKSVSTVRRGSKTELNTSTRPPAFL